MKLLTGRAPAIAVLGAFLGLGLVPVLAGCHVEVGTPSTISKSDLEKQAIESLTKSVGQRPDAVTCDGDIEAKAGATQRCVLTAGGQKVGLTATVKSAVDGKAEMNFQVDDKPLPG